MKILIIGSGGREHALAWKIAQSDKAEKIYCAPGNAGIAEYAECVPIGAMEFDRLADFATEKNIDLTVVGMDDPLVGGIVDAFESKGLRVFGPRKNAAILEGSKAFSKDLMKKYGIPTAAYENFGSPEEALAYLETAKYPIVLKADGLALGKGVLICQNHEEAVAGVQTLMVDKQFGNAGNTIVVEEFLTGREVSVLSFVDGKTIRIMTSAQDHKRAMDGDQGLNTGGMGTFSPSPFYTAEVDAYCKEHIYQKTVDAMRAEGRPFQGVIFFGLMLTADGPKVLEYNARFGDPEAQVVLPRMKNDIIDVFNACVDGTLDTVELEFEDNAAVCVVLASDGYPVHYKKGFPISGLEQLKGKDGYYVFHAGTCFKGEDIVTNGGRVLGVTAKGANLVEARKNAYEATELISFENKYMRHDIGKAIDEAKTLIIKKGKYTITGVHRMKILSRKGETIKRNTRWKTGMLCLALLLAAAGGAFAAFFAAGSAKKVLADTATCGVVTADSVNVRSGAGTTYSVLTDTGGSKVQLDTGDSVTVTGKASASDGSTWYKITFTYEDGVNYSGYMSSKYITTYTEDADFDAYLDAQGFPESYKQGLQALHALYPNWVFVADELDYTWEEALAGQMVLGRSLVAKSSITSYKSTASGAYDWSTGTWTTFDGGSWNAASEEIVAYCMDPRNFLNATQIFQFEQLSYDSSLHTISGVENIISGTFMDGATVTNTSGKSVSYAQALMDAASSSGVSPYHLASRIIQEMGTSGSSNSISGTVSGYAGYYNYYNIGAYAANGNSAIVNGLIYAKGGTSGTATTYGRPWNTRYKAIIGGASYIGSGYISIGQDTLYYEKFDYVGTPYTHQYMTNVLAPQSEASKMAKAYSDSMKASTAFTFKIPVYKDMPATACAKPTSDDSPNTYLSALAVTGQTLSPTFSGAVTSYSLTVANSVTSIKVTATAVDSTATVSGTGSKNLSVGSNTVSVKVTASNGDVRTYTITVIREEAESSPTFTISEYTQTGNSSLKGFTVGSTVSDVLGKISVTNGTKAVTNSSGTKKSSTSTIATGDKIVIYDSAGTAYATYTVLIYGDINGDGALDIKDLLIYKQVIIGKSSLSGAYQTAGDLDGDGSITIKELLKMKKQILGTATISQS